MLVSHRKKFIFIKTGKTAGTSTEVFLQRYCLPEDGSTRDIGHLTDEIVSEAGIIGRRGPKAKETADRYYNHMTASELRDLHPLWFDNYFKVCNIRNPFDVLVSAFWHFSGPEKRSELSRQNIEKVKTAFQEYCWKTPKYTPMRKWYLIDGEIAIDFFIRFERLSQDVETLLSTLNIPAEVELPRLKTGNRAQPWHYSVYYSNDLVDHFTNVWCDLLAELQYSFEDFR